MKRLMLIATILVLAPTMIQAQSVTDGAHAAVRAPLESYLLGQSTGERAHYEQAFHPDAELFGIRDGRLVRMSAPEYMDRAASGRPAPDESDRKRWIESIGIAGDTAVAKLVLDYPSVRFTDYMSLVRTDGRWLIVNKTYMAEPKTAPPGSQR